MRTPHRGAHPVAGRGQAGDGVVAVAELAQRRLEQRRAAGEAFFGATAPALAALCHRMAERFARGGRLVAVGTASAARSDVRHVTVEFVHPVIVGKRALPALGLVGDGAPLASELALTVAEADIVMAFGEPGDDPAVGEAVAGARRAGALTVAFAGLGAEVELDPGVPDPFVRQELTETAYHVLWELVHVFFEHRGLLEGRTERRVHDVGASSFLYPFLGEQESDLDTVLGDVAASAQTKFSDVCALRASTLHDEGAAALDAAAAALRGGLDAGGRLLSLGNGGSATDATDAVADFLAAPAVYGWPARRAFDLGADAAVLTALANDIGTEAIFARQIIAHGRPGDVVLALSTSGNSLSVLDALAEARRRELTTIALVGYDGGRIAAEGLADHLIVSPSQYIPRIQEAQATVYHLLRELVA